MKRWSKPESFGTPGTTMANKGNKKRMDLDPVRRRHLEMNMLDRVPLPAVSLPWVPMLVGGPVLSQDYTDFRPKIDQHRFLDAVHLLGGFELLGEANRWKALLKRGTKDGGWLREGVPDPTESKLWPLRRAAIEALALSGRDVFPCWSMGHHLRLKVYVRTVSNTVHKATGKSRSWIGAGKLIPAAMTALRGILWVDDDQVREIQIRVEPTKSPHYRDIWTVRVEECFATDAPAWTMGDPSEQHQEPPE
uniref:Uncharacterized protein n=1 Tax=uncultured marine virus TaxID=186617 RepID=A0A0F7L476_9VIRU|nr:hypothetical protein [uncultured marine virus]